MYVYIVDSLPSSASPALTRVAGRSGTGPDWATRPRSGTGPIGRPGPDRAAISRHPIMTGRLTLQNAANHGFRRVSTLRRGPGDRLARYSVGPAGRRNGRGQRSDRSTVPPRVMNQPVGDRDIGDDGGR